MLERFLDELGRELAKSHPPGELQARLIEAELHVKEGIEARLELGMGFAEAQREALEAFGRPAVLAKAERPSAQPRLLLLGAGYALMILTFFVSWWAATPSLVTLIVIGTLLLWFALAAAFAAFAYRSRRSAPLAVFATGCAASLAVAMTLGLTTIPRRGAGLLPRARVAAVRSSVSSRLQQRLAEGGRLRQEVDRLDGLPGIEAFRCPGGFHVPIPSSAQGWGLWLVYHDVTDAAGAREDVRDAWRTNAAEVRQLRDDVAELDGAVGHPLQSLLTTTPEVLSYGVSLTALVTFFDLILGSAGAVVLRRRSRKGALGA